jgi:hypothetical protein
MNFINTSSLGRVIVFSAVALAVRASQTPPTDQVGAVAGVVLDDKATPIPGAKVYDEPLGVVRIGKDHFVVTDEHGRFYLKDVPPGNTMLIATKTEWGYPDARFIVYVTNEVLPTVEVRANQTTSDVVVKLLARGGVLRGRIIDAVTKKAIPSARVTISRADRPESYLETDPANDGSFEFLIPSKPTHLSVEAKGYNTWVYERSIFSKDHAPLVIAPGASTNVDVYLEPAK